MLDVPEGIHPLAVIPIGFPAEPNGSSAPAEALGRKSPDEVVGYDRFPG